MGNWGGLVKVTRLAEFLVAILGGNAIYFWLLLPLMPAEWHHRPSSLDRGLLVDFALCVGLYWLLRGIRSRFDRPPGPD